MTQADSSSPLLVHQVDWYLTRRMRLSANSRHAYRGDLRLMLRTLAATIEPALRSADLADVDAVADHLTVDDLTVDNVEGAFALINAGAFRAHGTGPRSGTSVQRTRACITKFCDRLNDQLLIPRNPMSSIESVRLPRTLPKALSQQQATALIAAAADEPPPSLRVRWPVRDVALIKTALYTGARASELTALRVGRIGDNPDGPFVHIIGKGEHERTVPLPHSAAAALTDYLSVRITTGAPAAPVSAPRRPRMRRNVPDEAPLWQQVHGDEPLFVTTDGAPMTRGYLYRLVDHVYRQAGMPAMTRGKGVAVHALRHTYATLLHETGASVLEIQRLLGHTSPATSARYVTVSTAGLHGLTEGITAGLE